MSAISLKHDDTLGGEVLKMRVSQRTDPYSAFYLYYRPTDAQGTAGEVAIATEPPAPDWHLADPTRISPAWEDRHVTRFCFEVMRRLPILGH
jgi:hypothetical protein